MCSCFPLSSPSPIVLLVLQVQKRLDALLLSVSVLVLSVALSAGLIIQRTELVQRIVGCTSMAVVLCYFTMPIWDVWTALRTFQRGGLSW